MGTPRVRFALGPPASRALKYLAIACAALPLPFAWARPSYLVSVAVVAALLSIGLAVAHRVRTRPHGWLVMQPWGLSRVLEGASTIVRFADPFGITVLACQARRRAILAITTPVHTRFVGVRLDGPAGIALLEHASMVADGDVLTAHAGGDDSLSAEDALALLRAVRERAPTAQRRLYLSGTRGERIVLDGAELRIDLKDAQPRRFDSATPVDWRGFVFHESLGTSASIYQATWVKQGSSEVVFVAQLPTELLLAAKTGSLSKTGARRVLQATPDEPPRGELRTGIERVFMIPLREALARAPRAARPAQRASSPGVEA